MLNTKNKIKFAVIFGAILFGVLNLTQNRQQAQTRVETAGQKFKNIKVLNEMPADQMGKVMNLMSAGLGVNCSFCHVGFDFEKDDNKHKEIARDMLRMTFEINKNYFKNEPEISCATCHNGRPHPQSAPNLNLPPAEMRPKQPEKKPTVEVILEKYAKALGAKTNLGKIKSRYIKAIRVEPDGKTEPEEIRQKDDKLLIETSYGDYLVAESFDGTSVWKSGNGSEIKLKPDEQEQIKREAQIFAAIDFKKIYSTMEVFNLDKINGREAFQIRATTADNLRERLYFDASTGLLVRRIASTPTILGDFQYQVDYNDYKDFGGAKLPTSIRFALPNITWTRKILEVKINASVDDAKFNLLKK